MGKNTSRHLAIILGLFIYTMLSVSCNKEEKVTYFNNPILLQGADPYVYFHKDGLYYTMVTRGDKLQLFQSRTFTNLIEGRTEAIWYPPEAGENSCCIWAPEIHYFDDTWYIYYSATDKSNPVDLARHVFVLKNTAENPFDGIWEDLGKVETLYPGIDGHIFEHKGERYFAYSPYIGAQSGINLAKLTSSTETEAEVTLGLPLYDWEKTPPREILEGPQFLVGPAEKVFIIYSAGACWDDNYGLGQFSANTDADFLDPASWTRSSQQVFGQSPDSSVFGPGHNCFTKSPDGKEDWIVYHAKPNSSNQCSERSMRAQSFPWDDNGEAVFGAPLSLTTEIIEPSGL